MKTFKKIALCLFATIISSYSYANIVELDAVNPDHCRQQILRSTDNLPVIAAYTSNSNDRNSKPFLEKFEILAKTNPEKTFFKWDAEKDVMSLTQTLCLQQLGIFASPSIILLAVFKDDNTGETFMSSPLRLSWAGEMTLTEMNKFINVSDSGMKKSVLLLKNRH